MAGLSFSDEDLSPLSSDKIVDLNK